MKAITIKRCALFPSRKVCARGRLAACADDVAITVGEGRGVGDLNI